jgi:hypothetical protein
MARPEVLADQPAEARCTFLLTAQCPLPQCCSQMLEVELERLCKELGSVHPAGFAFHAENF